MSGYTGSYRGRIERQQFAIQNFPEVFSVNSVLDVGGGENYLKSILEQTMPEVECVSVDLFGTPDVVANLNKSMLPVGENKVDSVVCLDVLEHLETIHSQFMRLLEVARKYVLISLPNEQNWLKRGKFLFGYPTSGKFGLPELAPDDRHRWMFNYNEARNFIYTQLEGVSAHLIREFPYHYRFNRWSARIINELLKNFATDNLSAWAYWCLIEIEGDW